MEGMMAKRRLIRVQRVLIYDVMVRGGLSHEDQLYRAGLHAEELVTNYPTHGDVFVKSDDVCAIEDLGIDGHKLRDQIFQEELDTKKESKKPWVERKIVKPSQTVFYKQKMGRPKGSTNLKPVKHRNPLRTC